MEIQRGSSWYDGKLEVLSRELLDELGCLIFLGAGASVFPPDAKPAAGGEGENPDAPKRLKTGGPLGEDLAAKIKLDWHRSIPLSTVAFYYESFRNRKELNRWLQENLDGAKLEIPPTIDRLMDLIALREKRGVRNLILTTNYDRLFEEAYKERFKPEKPAVVIYNGANDPNKYVAPLHIGLGDDNVKAWYPRAPTTLYKIHGCVAHAPEDTRNLVVTDEDYINFLGNVSNWDPDKGLLQHVSGRLGSSTILFIGYSLSDWNFRVVYKATAEKHGNQNFAVQYFDHKASHSKFERDRWSALVNFWAKKKVDIINCDAAQFVADLVKVSAAACAA